MSSPFELFLTFGFYLGAAMKAHIQELEEEVKLLKNLSHPNIVVSKLYPLLLNDNAYGFDTSFVLSNLVFYLFLGL